MACTYSYITNTIYSQFCLQGIAVLEKLCKKQVHLKVPEVMKTNKK